MKKRFRIRLWGIGYSHCCRGASVSVSDWKRGLFLPETAVRLPLPGKGDFSVYLLHLGVAALAVAPSAIAGQQARPQAVEQPCELHIWPAKSTLAVIQYHELNAGKDKPFIRPNGRPTPTPLNRQRQLALLEDLDPALLGLPGATVVRHLEPTHRLEASKPVRHSNSDAVCQGELLIGAFVYESHVYTKRSLRLLIAFRRFDGRSDDPAWSFSTYASARLTRYPAQRAEDVDAANADLERAFVEAVHSFISYEQKAASRASEGRQ